MFETFKDDKLPQIKNNSKPKEVSKWKKLPVIKECYKKLFTNDEEDGPTFMETIIKKSSSGTKNISECHKAFTMSVVMYILNPKSEYIKINEEKIIPLFEKNLVSLFEGFAKLHNISKHYK